MIDPTEIPDDVRNYNRGRLIDLPAELEATDHNICFMLAMFAIDELVFSSNPRVASDIAWVMQALADAVAEGTNEIEPSVRRQIERITRLADGIECAVGPREGTTEGDALKRLREFKSKIAARRAR